jgi:hypothetical protein
MYNLHLFHVKSVTSCVTYDLHLLRVKIMFSYVMYDFWEVTREGDCQCDCDLNGVPELGVGGAENRIWDFPISDVDC